jgi:hypothetical protein
MSKANNAKIETHKNTQDENAIGVTTSRSTR